MFCFSGCFVFISMLDVCMLNGFTGNWLIGFGNWLIDGFGGG